MKNSVMSGLIIFVCVLLFSLCVGAQEIDDATPIEPVETSLPTTSPPEPVNPPVISNLKVSPSSFSPNGDEIDDTVTISAEASEVVRWTILIEGAGAPYAKIWGGEGKVLNVEWNGFSDILGTIVPNGKYEITVYAKGETGVAEKTTIVEVIGSSTIPIPVETTKPVYTPSPPEPVGNPPIISNLKASPDVFSPNGDGVDDKATISAEASGVVEWAIAIINMEVGEAYAKMWGGEGKTLNIEWDGFSDRFEEIVPDGEYQIIVYAGGEEGHAEETIFVRVIESPTTSIEIAKPVYTPSPELLENPPTITDLKAYPNPFSPNGDYVDDTTTISAEASEIVGWTVLIEGIDAPYAKIWGGESKVLSVEWDGLIQFLPGDVAAPDGTCTITVVARGKEGTAKETTTVRVIESPSINIERIEEVPAELIEEVPTISVESDVTISNINIPAVLERGKASEAVVTITNFGKENHYIDLRVSLNPHSTAVSIVPNKVKVLVPVETEIIQKIMIVPTEWAKGGRYDLVFRLQESGEDIYYETIPIRISEEIKKPEIYISSETLVVVRSDLLVDFVCAQSYAEPNEAPVIQVDPKGLTEENLRQARAYLQYGVKKAVIVGGPVAIPISIENQLREIGFDVERVGGANRYETASMVALLWDKAYTAVIANGDDEVYYMEAYQQAVLDRIPLLLSEPEVLPDSTIQVLQALGIEKVILGSGIKNPVIGKLKELGIAWK